MEPPKKPEEEAKNSSALIGPVEKAEEDLNESERSMRREHEVSEANESAPSNPANVEEVKGSEVRNEDSRDGVQEASESKEESVCEAIVAKPKEDHEEEKEVIKKEEKHELPDISSPEKNEEDEKLAAEVSDESDEYEIEHVGRPQLQHESKVLHASPSASSKLSSPESASRLCNRAESIVASTRRALGEIFPSERKPRKVSLRRLRQKCKEWRGLCDKARELYPKKLNGDIEFWEESGYVQIKTLEKDVEEFYDVLVQYEIDDQAINESACGLVEINENLTELIEEKKNELGRHLKEYKEVPSYSEEIAAIKTHLNEILSWNAAHIKVVENIEKFKPVIRLISDEVIADLNELHKQRVQQENESHRKCMERHKDLNKAAMKKNAKANLARQQAIERIERLNEAIIFLDKLSHDSFAKLVEDCGGNPDESHEIGEVSEYIKSEHAVLKRKLANATKPVDEIEATSENYKKKSFEIIRAKKERVMRDYEGKRKKLEQEIASNINVKQELGKKHNDKLLEFSKLEVELNKCNNGIAQQEKAITELNSQYKYDKEETARLEKQKARVENEIEARVAEQAEQAKTLNQLEEKKQKLNAKYIQLVKAPAAKKYVKRKQFPRSDSAEVIVSLRLQYESVAEEMKKEKYANDGLQLQWSELSKVKAINREKNLMVTAKETKLHKLEEELESLNKFLSSLS